MIMENFDIHGKMPSHIFQNSKFFDIFISLPVKNLKFFTYFHGDLHFSSEQIEKMKNSKI